jgi:hypothetical protein
MSIIGKFMSITVPIDPSANFKVERQVRTFLKALNSSGGKPLEQLSPQDARAGGFQWICAIALAVRGQPPCSARPLHSNSPGFT